MYYGDEIHIMYTLHCICGSVFVYGFGLAALDWRLQTGALEQRQDRETVYVRTR